MNDILIYILMAVIGGFIGKKIQNIYPWMDTLQNSFLIFLIASLGIKIGTNDDVMRNFGRLGIYAFIFTIVIMLGSIGAVSLLKKIFITGKSAPVTSASPSVSLQEKPDYRKDPSGVAYAFALGSGDHRFYTIFFIFLATSLTFLGLLYLVISSCSSSVRSILAISFSNATIFLAFSLLFFSPR